MRPAKNLVVPPFPAKAGIQRNRLFSCGSQVSAIILYYVSAACNHHFAPPHWRRRLRVVREPRSPGFRWAARPGVRRWQELLCRPTNHAAGRFAFPRKPVRPRKPAELFYTLAKFLVCPAGGNESACNPEGPQKGMAMDVGRRGEDPPTAGLARKGSQRKAGPLAAAGAPAQPARKPA